MLGNKVHLKDRRTKNYIDHYKVHVYLKDVPDLRVKEILNIHKSPNNILLVIVSTKNVWQNLPSKSHALIEENASNSKEKKFALNVIK
jgi:hypothetical protein